MKRHTIHAALLLGTLLLGALIGAVSVASPAAQAQQAPPRIYVSPSGSDATGNGSIANPYATISHAVALAPPHAIVIVMPGVYNEMVNITRQLTLESLTSQPSSTVINAIGQTYGIEVLGSGASGTVIEGLTVEHANNHGVFVQDASDVTVENNAVVSNGLHPNACPAAPAPPSGPCIEENKAIELSGTSYSTVVDNTVVNNVADGGIGVSDEGQLNPGGLESGAPSPGLGNVISGNTVIGNTIGCGIVVAAYNPGEGVVDNVVSNNYVVNGLPGGIVVAADVPHTSAVNNSVIYNTVLNNLIPGIIVHSNTPGDVVQGTKIVGNTVSGNGGFGPKTTGITLIGNINGSTIVTDTTISGNVVHNEFFGILASNATDTSVLSDNSFDASVTVPVQGAAPSQLSLAALGGEMSTISQLQSSSASTVSSLNAQVSTLSAVSYAALGVAIVLGLAAIILSVRKRG
ncbi:MAG: right-handed parallel beta-helix repeat-containing protein [Nitrososphaerota archaeon]|nr:right-handed parallel beta-helix repeat-containing protein [Nitrososphaerota archaeon]MDG7025580.1 right-handed parallel beta-helix repeat-containing protein [Nitrososphaerota archaeon]